MKILVVGSGGREHALAWRLAGSDLCRVLYCAPGNPGMEEIADCINIAADDISGLTAFAAAESIDLVVIGPEAPLVAGLADRLRAKGIAVFGPSEAAAKLEGSKGFTKDLCAEFGIPTAAYGRFSDPGEAEAFIRDKGAPIVVKADGLAAGKGVLICQTEEDAIAAAYDMLSGASFGLAGSEIVIEEFLDGEELSFFALTDGESVLPFESAQDHKRVGEGDTGPNTGGMGAYSPAHLMTDDLQQKIMDRIILPTVRGMKERGTPFQGVLFAGLMVVKGDPYLIEYNARFGDPECQTLMLRLQDDLLTVLNDCATGKLSAYRNGLHWSSHTSLCVVMAAQGYPGVYKKGGVIEGLEEADLDPGVKIFHAGTGWNAQGKLVSQGGRVLSVCAAGETVEQAQASAYAAVDKISWTEGFCRRDIGWRAVGAQKTAKTK